MSERRFYGFGLPGILLALAFRCAECGFDSRRDEIIDLHIYETGHAMLGPVSPA